MNFKLKIYNMESEINIIQLISKHKEQTKKK